MKILFIQGGSRVRICENGKKYVDGNFNNDIWKRYLNYCDELNVLLRKQDVEYNEEDIKDKFNYIDTDLINLELLEDIYAPKINFLNYKIRKNIKQKIKECIEKSDFIIIRSIGNFYTNTALYYCKKFNKKYLIEVTGFAFEGLWYHSLLGKIVAIPRELKLKKSIKKAPNAVYVTERSLQQRYPCDGKKLGCSDVEIKIEKIDSNEKITRIKSKLENDIPLVLGTAAFLNVRWKGQHDVIKALYCLKKQGIKFKYELIGAGDATYLNKLIKKFKLESQVNILGVKKHEEVFEWLDKIDIYIQPSYQEGLCRAIVEAMSRGCPVICSNVGGNKELISSDMIFKKGKIRNIVKILKEINVNKIEKCMNENLIVSKKYSKDYLDKKRDDFYNNVIKEDKR